MPTDQELKETFARCFARGIPVDPLPEPRPLDPTVPHAPVRTPNLSPENFILAVKNALRFFPVHTHAILAPEFAEELRTYGHIYMYRFRPTEYEMRAYSVEVMPGACVQAKCIMLMTMNNLDRRVAQFPEELVVYGGNGSAFNNWAQYHLFMQYLTRLTEDQTLVMNSGTPMGLFPSFPSSPRMVMSNGMLVPNYSKRQDYDTMYALGVTIYGQMTAGSMMYIGPQGIVHGTTIVLMSAARKYLNNITNNITTATTTTTTTGAGAGTGVDAQELLQGRVYLSSGLGGMSGAQGKAGVIAGAVTVIAEVDAAALDKRYHQGWINERCYDLDALWERVKKAKKEKEAVAIGYLGNVVDIWEKCASDAAAVQRGEMDRENAIIPDIASDQTSLHNAFNGGYYPASLSFDESKKMMHSDPARFKDEVQASLRRHITAVNTCVASGTKFWDYGNCFLLETFRAGGDVVDPTLLAKAEARGTAIDDTNVTFKYPSYVQEFMGDIFSLGFGPFRWVCCSGKREDLKKTDKIAADVIRSVLEGNFKDGWENIDDSEALAAVTRVNAHGDVEHVSLRATIEAQLRDNLNWLEQACVKHDMTVGSQARILYADTRVRMAIATALNEAIARGELGPVVLSRDHHDVSGTDSPFRETSNITDGSRFTADMAVQNVIGCAIRGATYVALHNGGGVGIGEVINGGTGIVLTGTPEDVAKARCVLAWDTQNGMTRRAWDGNPQAVYGMERAQQQNEKLRVTKATVVDDEYVAKLIGM